jgi:hypothetical protein
MADKFYLSVVDHVTAVVGDQSLIRSDHVLPHFSKSGDSSAPCRHFALFDWL